MPTFGQSDSRSTEEVRAVVHVKGAAISGIDSEEAGSSASRPATPTPTAPALVFNALVF
jgi:hypothetical protein